MSEIKAHLTSAMKDAMRAREKERLGTIRMALSAIKQIEIDEQITLDDIGALKTLDKMVKQRREAAKQYIEAERQELADKELAEVEILKDFLPEQLRDDEQDKLITDVITQTGASEMKDMGKIMGLLRGKVQGRVDMGTFSAKIKQHLS